ncbi:retrotransposon protein, putative, ty1-copia subclass [Tanacetum coccineum]
MNAEMKSMKDNQVWNLVDLPPNYKTVGSNRLFKKKTDMDGNIHAYKAHLVVKGFTQTYRVDYEETFSPVADIKVIRILIAIPAYYDYEIWKMDAKTVFLNGRLNEDVYMVQPEGFVNPKYLRRVCKLKRSIYGLKEASRSWNKRFDEEIKKYGFTYNPNEPWMDTSKRRTIPMQPNIELSKSQGPFTPTKVKRMEGIPYASAVGSIMYAVRNTKDMFLVYGGDSITELSVTCYTDASWETDRNDLRSQMGYVFVRNVAAMESIWIRKFISGLGVVPNIDETMNMYCDSTGAITIADEPSVQKDNNFADPLTKPMPCVKHVEHVRSIRLRPAGSFM